MPSSLKRKANKLYKYPWPKARVDEARKITANNSVETMFLASRCLKRISHCNKTFEVRNSCFFPSTASICLLLNPITTSQNGLTRCADHITSVPLYFSQLGLLFTNISRYISTARSLTTKTFKEEEEVNLDEIFATIENAPKPVAKICSSYIDKLCRSGDLLAAAKLLKFLSDRHIYVSSNVVNLLLLSASEKNDIDLICQVFKDAVATSASLTSTSYLNIAKAFAKTNDLAQLQRFVKDISELTLPRMTVLNRIIFSFGECRKIDLSLLIFNQIKGMKCKPDLITYNIVLDILGRAGCVDEMILLFSSMKEAAIFPDVISYNTLLNGLKKVGRVDLCAVYFKEMGDNGIEPDLLTYTALIQSFGRSGNIEESIRLFSEMKARKIRPSIYIYRSLIDMLKKMGNLELAMKFFEDMNSCPSELVGPNDFKSKKN